MPQEANNTANLRNWLRGCAAFGDTRFGVDFLGENATEYALISVPSGIQTRSNILGKEVPRETQTQNFIIASRAPYGADIQQNLENLAVWQDVVTWIFEQSNAFNFPEWEGGRVRSIVPTLTGAPIQAGSSAARYQIQIRVTYQTN